MTTSTIDPATRPGGAAGTGHAPGTAMDRSPSTANAAAALTAEDVWRDFGEPLQGFVRRRIADPHAADDVLGDVMLRIHQHIGHLDDREKVTAWVFRIARNAVTDHYRRAGRRAERLDDTATRAAADDGSGPDGWVEDQRAVMAELAVMMRPLVEQLPRDYRRALELTDLGDHTQADAARAEGVSLSGMKSRVQRGRRQLAVLLAQHCEITLDATGLPADCAPRNDAACGCELRPID
jgi:RNA polymerase sigma-70 factor, ECF subfamily